MHEGTGSSDKMGMNLRRLFTLSAAILSLSLADGARAEYRVFRLKIERHPPAPAKTPGSEAAPADENAEPLVRYVESNLDPEQYRQYHLIRPDETITYVDTWRCYGRTDFKEYCRSPRAPASVEGEDAAAPAK